jgi:hypothetical protein
VNIRVLVLAMVSFIVVVALIGFVLVRQTGERSDALDGSVAEAPRAPAVDAPAAPDALPPAAAPSVPARSAPATPAAPAAPAVPTVTTLRIETDVPGALVFLDREYMGTAPLTMENLQPGRRQLNVSAEGYDVVARTIELEPGRQDLTINLREVRLDAAVDVEHRHRLGSCRGRLVADVNGIRYQTDHEDAFSASLADIDVFQVDFVENNLRVRLRNGRQYNFTQPDGDANRLLVFHREVERAREQLGR